ncbi:MAG: Rpn family recombination-promoting nuclease/putative transposase, partial [Bacteroidaceae bacterium]|nr:Rpn family recombination-promoting nuclease/putative transposase [Bacteroidaceae bacterium]
MRYYDPRYDITFKKVFNEPDLLISFLNALLPLKDDEQVVSIEYLSPEMLPDTPTNKFSVVDVRCKDMEGRQFIVEMQMVWSEEFKSRVLLNASKAYVRQLEKEERYDLLHPVYSLNLVNEVFEKDLPADEFYHFYQLVHERHSEKVIKGLHIVFVELPKFMPRNWGEKKMMVLWLRFLKEINEKTTEVPAELLENPLIGKAVSLMEEAAMTEEERYLYEKNLDSISLEKTAIEGATKKGIAEGEAKEKLATAQRMKAKGYPIGDIAEITGLTQEQIEKLS